MQNVSFSGVFAALVISSIIGFFVLAPTTGKAERLPQVPVPDMVTMVDLGAKKCILCKMMAPYHQGIDPGVPGTRRDPLHRCLGKPGCRAKISLARIRAG